MIVDQTEELITLAGPVECDAFLDLLARALDADSLLWIIVIMRSEFLTALARFAAQLLQRGMLLSAASVCRSAAELGGSATRWGFGITCP